MKFKGQGKINIADSRRGGGGSEHPKKKPVSTPDLRAVAHYHRTQCPDQNGHWVYEGQHFWLRGIPTSDKNGNAFPAQ